MQKEIYAKRKMAFFFRENKNGHCWPKSKDKGLGTWGTEGMKVNKDGKETEDDDDGTENNRVQSYLPAGIAIGNRLDLRVKVILVADL